MTKRDVIASIAGSTGIPQAAVKDVVKAFFDATAAEIPGRNPWTGEALQIKAHNTVKFLPSKVLKARVNE